MIKRAKTACFNSGHRIENHFGEITEMIGIGKGSRKKAERRMRRFGPKGSGSLPDCDEIPELSKREV